MTLAGQPCREDPFRAWKTDQNFSKHSSFFQLKNHPIDPIEETIVEILRSVFEILLIGEQKKLVNILYSRRLKNY